MSAARIIRLPPHTGQDTGGWYFGDMDGDARVFTHCPDCAAILTACGLDDGIAQDGSLRDDTRCLNCGGVFRLILLDWPRVPETYL